jgi:hypothetical protein
LKCPSIIKQFQFAVVSKHKKKFIQFAYVFILLNKCKALTNYERFKSFFEFLKLPKIYTKKHCNDAAKWERANYIHIKFLKVDKNTMCMLQVYALLGGSFLADVRFLKISYGIVEISIYFYIINLMGNYMVVNELKIP